jgi:hypothetical protein
MVSENLLEDDLNYKVSQIQEDNSEGFEILREESLAEQRRSESKFDKLVRRFKKKLGLRKSGAKRIKLN